MSNKRLTFYFNTDLPDQAELYNFLKSESNMNQTVRDGLSLTVELRKINSALPELLKTTLQNNGSITDVKAIFDIMANLPQSSKKTGQGRGQTESVDTTMTKEAEPHSLSKTETIANAKKIFGKK
ncbi:MULTISPECIES: hypothetical protein [unclassified Providencia]|uniref:hypothetical protein n=1 Tax=unclassified Providencia TaxID=2633465 RepID=UPI002349AB28|nr:MULTISPECIES: hypothetical protein [unclassified Providencia]